MRIMDGKALGLRLRTQLAERVSNLRLSNQITPGLAVVLVGDDPASKIYTTNKAKLCKAAGMLSFEYALARNTDQQTITSLIKKLNADEAVDGILVQLPLPGHIDSQAVIDSIDPAKDVDGFHPVNVGKLSIGTADGFVPCTPMGCMALLHEYVGPINGLNAIVIGRSNIVGKPLAQLLLQRNCTVTLAHSRTTNLTDLCRNADIIAAAIGKPHFIKADWVRRDAVVLDIGINRLSDGTITGDVDFDAVKNTVKAITPVPGGVGPMTIACLLSNTYKAACRRRGLPYG
jgi:methylenetetrahydrofolate dehydrogenase (NADP+)/methenyltetrahydrofolate cyclohydrolase